MLTQFETWLDRLGSLDGAWLFLLILGFVIVVVRLWSRSLKQDESGERIHDD